MSHGACLHNRPTVLPHVVNIPTDPSIVTILMKGFLLIKIGIQMPQLLGLEVNLNLTYEHEENTRMQRNSMNALSLSGSQSSAKTIPMLR